MDKVGLKKCHLKVYMFIYKKMKVCKIYTLSNGFIKRGYIKNTIINFKCRTLENRA